LHPFQDKAALDWAKLAKTTEIATRFLDNVIDISHYPLKSQQEESYATRRIGLGITGLADVLVMLGMRYGDDASLQLASRMMKCIAETTWLTSIELAKERGVFPVFDAKKYGEGQFVKRLSADIQQAIQKTGMRNSHHNTIAPTGTISLLANNISNGIEPIFQPEYKRTVRLGEGELEAFMVKDYAYRLSSQKNLPKGWVDTQSLTPKDHLLMQAALQPFIDHAISKTINLPVDFPFAKLSDVYTEAYRLGLKGCTIYRPNAITGSVLHVADSDDIDRCCQLQ
jgi:ribonucleoside-diphosphate reductase alpha chain